MTKELIIDFLKKMGLALNAFVGYPETHPVVLERVKETGQALRNLGIETNIFSMVFLENTIVIGNEKIDSSSLPIVANIIRKYRKIGVESISMNLMISDSDLSQTLLIAAKPPIHIKNVKDPNELLLEKGIETVTFNTVKIKIGATDEEFHVDKELLKKASKKELEELDYKIDEEFNRFIEEMIDGIIPKRFFLFIKDKIESGEIVHYLAKAKELLESEYGKESAELYDFFNNFFKVLPNDLKEKFLENISTDLKEIIVKTVKDESVKDMETIKKDESIVITDKITYEKMRQKLKDSLDLKDLSDLLNNLTEMSKSETKEVRKNAYNTLFKMTEDAIHSGKEPFYIRLITTIIENSKDEKDEELLQYIFNSLSAIHNLCMNFGITQLSKDIINFFSEQINVKEKRIFVLRALSEINTIESLNLILSLLWEDVPIDEIKNTLKKIKIDFVKDLFEMLIECDDKDVRLKLIELIPNFGKTALDYALIKINDERWYVRRNIVKIIASIGEISALNQIKSLKETDPRVKEEILKAVYHLGGASEEQFIINYIFDSNYQIAIHALNMLKNIVTQKSVPKIMQRFFVNVFSPPMENNIKIILLDILMLLKDQRAFDTLKRLITEKKMMSFSYPENIRVKACEVLSILEGSNVIDLMKSLRNDKNPTIKEIASKYLQEHQ